MKNSTPGGNLYLNKVYSALKRGLVYGRTYVERGMTRYRPDPFYLHSVLSTFQLMLMTIVISGCVVNAFIS